MFIYPYKKGSKSAKSLSKSLNCKVLTRPRQSRRDKVINWGSSMNPFRMSSNVLLNKPMAVLCASNKITAFKTFKENNIPHPDFTESITVAKEWIEDGYTIVCRTLINSHSGKGIVIANKIEDLAMAPLYVKYFPKTYEFRIHVFNGKIIDYIQKRKRNDIPETEYNKYVRNHCNGWVFCRDNIIERDDLKTIAIDAVKALGLDFGAVDIVTTKKGTAKVLEVNTAPALEGTTLERYKKAIQEWSTT